jgi:hypothetical protein
MASRSHRGRRAAAAGTLTRARLAALGDTRAVRTLSAHEHRTAATLFALLALAYLWPVLLAGHVLSPTALLYLETPWSSAAPHDFMRYANGDLADVPISYYPWNALARAFLHSGTFPAWNPHAFAGTPLFANVEIAWASPFSLPLWILPLNYGLGVAAAAKLWAAGFGTYLLVRELRLGFWPAIVAGVGFALCAFNVVWLSHGVFVSVAAMLPWAIWLTERLVRRGRSADGIALTAVVAVALAGGHPGTQVHVLSATALYALVRVASGGPLPVRERVARLGLVAAAVTLGALITAVLLLPGERTAHDTAGALARAHGSPSFASSRLTFGSLRTALFPDWWGRPSEHLQLGPSHYRERTFYAGVVPLLLACVALVAPGGWRRKGPFVLLGALGAAVALRAPGLWTLVIHLPLFDQVQNGRALLLFTFAVPVLAAFGLQALLDRAVSPRRLATVLAAGLLAALAAIASLQLDGDTLDAALRQVLRRSDAVRAPDALALASVVWWLLLFAAAAAIVALPGRRRQRRRLLGGLLALVVALDMLHFAHGYQPMGPASTVIPPKTPAIAYLQRQVGEGRIVGVGAGHDNTTLAADWSTQYALRDVRGDDEPFPTLRYFGLWRLIDPTAATASRLDDISGAGPKVLGMLGVRYVVLPAGAVAYRDALRLAYDGPDARIYANELALPRAIVASRVDVASSDDEELAAVASEAFDPREQAIVRGDELQREAPALTGGGSVRVVDEHDDEVRLRATLRADGLVVLDDQWAPGWGVQVDGRPARALRTDVVLRGVVVPAGTHEIVWRYRVPGLRAGAALSAAGLALALAWVAAIVRRRRPRRRGASR